MYLLTKIVQAETFLWQSQWMQSGAALMVRKFHFLYGLLDSSLSTTLQAPILSIFCNSSVTNCEWFVQYFLFTTAIGTVNVVVFLFFFLI